MQALLHIAKVVSGNRTTESWLEATVVKGGLLGIHTARLARDWTAIGAAA